MDWGMSHPLNHAITCHHEFVPPFLWATMEKQLYKSPNPAPGGGGYSLIWPIRVCTAEQGMVFTFQGHES